MKKAAFVYHQDGKYVLSLNPMKPEKSDFLFARVQVSEETGVWLSERGAIILCPSSSGPIASRFDAPSKALEELKELESIVMLVERSERVQID